MIQRHEAHRALRRTTERFGDAAHFFRTWAEKPLQLGAVTPSSRYLSRAIASYVDPRSHGPVVEIGAGTGPVTEALIAHGVAESRLILLEYSPEFCDLLRRRFPSAKVIQGDAYALSDRLRGVLHEKAAAIICGLPLFTKPEAKRLALLKEAFRHMKPSAPFIQFTYATVSPMPLKNAFFTAHGSPRIWRNMPPARVWVYHQIAKN